MTFAPPPEQQPQVRTAGALQRVYADGRYHWATAPATTLCALPYTADDVAKPGAVECRICMDIAAEVQL